MKTEIILTLKNKTVLTAYSSFIVPSINDCIFIEDGTKIFKVHERFFHMFNNKVVLIGEIY